MLAPFNLNQWINDNRDKLKPPVSNKNLYHEAGDFIVMVVAGPNARKDYHYNESEELYYQVEGNIVVKIIDNGVPRPTIPQIEQSVRRALSFFLRATVYPVMLCGDRQPLARRVLSLSRPGTSGARSTSRFSK